MRMQSVILAVISLVAMASATPVAVKPGNEPPYNNIQENPIVDLDSLVHTVLEMQYNLDILLRLIAETAQNISAFAPHVIHKRQTTVTGSVTDGPEGPTGSVDVTHQTGGTTLQGNANVGRGGIGWSVGGSHETSGGWNFGGNFGQLAGGEATGRIEVGHTFNNGDTKIGGSFERTGNTNFAGLTFSHTFKK